MAKQRVSRRVRHPRSVPWPPRPEPRELHAAFTKMRDGEPFGIELPRWAGDTDPRGYYFDICCGCGLKHLVTYQLQHVNGEFYLTKRFYRIGNPRKRSK